MMCCVINAFCECVDRFGFMRLSPVAGKWTQLQITFEAVDITDDALREKYPMGVKVSHRAFAQDDVLLLRR